MKKDLNKILTQTLYTYVFLLFIIFILKLAGLDYFGLDINNPIIQSIDKFATKYYLIDIWYFITLTFYSYVIISISSRQKGKRTMIIALFITAINTILSYTIKPIMAQNIIAVCDILVLYLGFCICNNFKMIGIKRFIVIIILNTIYQALSLSMRNVSDMNINDSVTAIMINLDYILMMLLTYIIYFNKGGVKLCGEAGLYSLLLTSLRSLPTKLQKKLQDSRTKINSLTKEEKVTSAIYIPLFILWNAFTVAVVLFVAFLNDSIIECIFILNAFWMSKTVFGKSFHMKNAFQCFIVSNLTYYVLNRITTPIGISIIIPTILGILLSYFTSMLVKDSENPKELKLYRGMPENELNDIITKVTSNKLDIKICKLFYCDRIKEERIAQIVNYSKESVQKHKKRINNMIKDLNRNR